MIATPKLHVERVPLKLDLGAGQSPREGFEGVDLHAAETKHRVDLFKFPFPWEDDSVDELHSSHFVEHLPAREVEERDIAKVRCPECLMEQPPKATAYAHRVDTKDGGVVCSRVRQVIERVPVHQLQTKFVGQDFFFAFFDECWRILKHDATMTVVIPNARCNRAFQDPTHRRFIVAETFGYLLRDWRTANKLDHYRVRCNFTSQVNPIIPVELSTLHPEAQARRFHENWNTILDWHAVLKVVKP